MRLDVIVFSWKREKCQHAVVNRNLCIVFFSRIKLFLDVLMKEVLHPESQSPNGVKFHFVTIYLDELSKVGGKEVSISPTSCQLCSETTAHPDGALALPQMFVGCE